MLDRNVAELFSGDADSDLVTLRLSKIPLSSLTFQALSFTALPTLVYLNLSETEIDYQVSERAGGAERNGAELREHLPITKLTLARSAPVAR